MRKNTQ